MNDNNVVDITKDLKRAEFKAKWRKRFNKAKNWVSDNKQVLIVAVPAVATAIGSIARVANRRINIATEERNKDRRCYDARLGHYWELKRKVRNDEWVKIDKRMAKGERLSDILYELGLLK